MKLQILPLAIALGLPAVATAQTVDTGTAPDATQLDEIVVTATRTAVTVDQSLAAVEVIDREEIQRSQARSLPELLRGRAGVNLVNQGGLGKLTTLFMRGTESDHTLFLVDGVRVGSATSGLASLQDIPVELIERVEIVRGPRSSLYGSEAIGGVIQVFTRRERAGVTPHFKLGAGSNDLREAGFGIDAGLARGWFGIDYNHQATKGINACSGAGFPVFAGCFMDNPDPDRDGYENNAISVRGGIDITHAWTLEARGMRAEGNNEYDADPAFGLPDESDTVQQVLGGKLRFAPNERVQVQLVGGRNTDRSDNSRGGIFIDRFESRRDSATLQGDFGSADGQLLTAGVDWSEDRGVVASVFSGFTAERSNRAAFVQYQGNYGAHDLQASLRHDDNDQFGGHDTGSLAWGMDAAHGLRFTASAGSAFKAPSFNELYYPFFGNPDLLPEASESFEVGMGQSLSRWHWQFNAFHTTIDNLIVYDTAIFAANNLERARIRGGEFTAGGTLAGWDVSASASVVDPRNRSPGANHDKRLPRRARHSARLDLDRGVGDWRIGASWIGEGSRYDDVANTLALGGHATLDLHVEYAMAADWAVQARIGNVLDRDYETAAYYNQPGREFGISLRYRPVK